LSSAVCLDELADRAELADGTHPACGDRRFKGHAWGLVHDEEFDQFVKSESQRWRAVVKDLNIKYE